MLRPSYTDLLDVITKDSDDITLGSRYTIVIAAAKRARQLVDHADPLVSDTKVDKPVSIAINELYQGKIKVHQGCPAAEEAEETAEDMEPAKDVMEASVPEEETTEEI